jgi:hypothetical protein
MPDPAILAWPEKDVGNRDPSIQYIRADQWSYYYVEVSEPKLRELPADLSKAFD